jgi:hypothetical protein
LDKVAEEVLPAVEQTLQVVLLRLFIQLQPTAEVVVDQTTLILDHNLEVRAVVADQHLQ